MIDNVEKGDDDLAAEVMQSLGFEDGFTNSNAILA